ncbi:MAG: hypothetical protein LBK60_02250 [Verrucomicrobiales bacterium]|jgi:hypothetical protein|nr:hypothetical protein [Verrucomicrobiales bacterium]
MKPKSAILSVLSMLSLTLSTPAADYDGRYLDLVKKSADALLANAVDHYGEKQTALIISVLDATTGKPLERTEKTINGEVKKVLPPLPNGIRSYDRVAEYGSNASLQVDLYRVLQELSRLTGDARYADAAREALLDLFRVTQHPDTGLLAWGEHTWWDCLADAVATNMKNTHEPKRAFGYFDLVYQVEPERMLRYARGLWDHQIANKKTGDFSRHATYDKHGPRNGFDFPKEGGFFINTWARAYEKSQAPEFLTAVSVLANRYLGRTNERGLLDWDSTRHGTCVPLWLESLAIEADDAVARVDEPTAALLKKLVAAQDQGFLGLKHDPAGRGFICNAVTASGEPLPRPERKSDGWSQPWGLGYGSYTTVMFALLANTRQQQLGGGEQAGQYRKLLLQAADLYHTAKPDSQKDLWVCEYGMVIGLEVAAWRLTGKAEYLDTAKWYGDEAVKIFWGAGADGKQIPGVLPRASVRATYYDAITYPDTLLLALLALHEACAGLDGKVPVSDTIR